MGIPISILNIQTSNIGVPNFDSYHPYFPKWHFAVEFPFFCFSRSLHLLPIFRVSTLLYACSHQTGNWLGIKQSRPLRLLRPPRPQRPPSSTSTSIFPTSACNVLHVPDALLHGPQRPTRPSPPPPSTASSTSPSTLP